MDKQTNINFRVKMNLDKSGVSKIDMEMTHLFTELNKVQEQADKTRKTIASVAADIASFSKAFDGITSAVNELTASYNTLDTAMRKVNTMAGLSKEGFERITDEVKALSAEIPLARDAIADGLYQVISNGVPQDNWIEFLNASARSAVGGIADLGQTVTVTSTIIKNYALGWEAAQDIQDKIQLTAKNGVTSFEQLAAALPRVTGNAASLGVSIDELMASFATLTGVTGNTSEVSTQLAAILSSLVKPSSEAAKAAAAMGIQFDAAAIKAKGGFEQFLTSLQSSVSAYAAATGKLEQEIYGNLFGSAEALRAVGALTGPLADKFRENIGTMAESAGTMDEAFGQMSDTAEAKTTLTANKIASLTDVVASSLSKLQPALSFIASATLSVQGFGLFYQAVKKAAAVCLTALAPALKTMRGHMIGLAMQARLTTTATTGAAYACQGLSTAIKGIGAVGIAITAITALFYAIGKLQKEAKEATIDTTKLKESTDRIAEGIGNARAEIDAEIAKLRALIDAKKDTTEAVNTLNSKYGEELGHQQTAAQWLDILTSKSKAYATAKALEAESIHLASEEYALGEKLRTNAEQQAKLRKEGRDTRTYFTGSVTMGSVAGASMGAGGETRTVPTDEMAALTAEEAELKNAVATNTEAMDRVTERLAKATAELKSGITGKTTVTPHGGGGKPDKATPAPEGSLKAVREQISAVKSQIELAVAPESRAALFKELQALEAEERAIRFRYEFPLLNSFNLKNLAGEIESATPAVKLEYELPDLEELMQSLPKISSGEPAEAVSGDTLDSYQQAAKGIGGIGSAMGALSKVMGESAAGWLNYAASVCSAVAQALPAIKSLVFANTAKAGSEAMSQNAAAGPFGWIAGIAAIAGVIAAIATLPKFAEGGIAYGPTVGLFGEYAGAANNPEVVAPLSKLEAILEPRTSLSGSIELRVRGRELVAVLNRENQYSSRR